MKQEFDLDLIEFKIKQRYNESMNWLNSLRDLLKAESLNDYQKTYLEQCKAELGACLASSIQATENLNDPDDVPRYMYDESGDCTFMYKGVEFDVQDLRNMRKSERLGTELYADVCVVDCEHKDDDGCFTAHILPDTWLYGSTSNEFEKYQPVHEHFLKAADDYINKIGLDKLIELQEADDE